MTTDPGHDRALFLEAVRLVAGMQFAARSTVQRKMRIGFVKTGRLFELMEAWGVIGPSEGTFSQEVLITAVEAEAIERELSV